MACTDPKYAYPAGFHPSGKPKLTFKRPDDFTGDPQPIPCQRCDSCKLDHAKEWATRLCHELQTSLIGSFLTLTYRDADLPADGSLSLDVLQKFIKRLRKYLEPRKIKFFACGEYGEERKRPHYHVLVFGYDFPDKRFWSRTKAGSKLYRSATLEKLWTFGFSSIGEINFQTAAYTARYTLKKTRDFREYERLDYESGELVKLKPEFITMSNGLGKDWWTKYRGDTDKDFLLAGEAEFRVKVPRYYDKLREKEDPDSLVLIKERRKVRGEEYCAKEGTRERLKAKAVVRKAQVKMLHRGYHSEKENVFDT